MNWLTHPGCFKRDFDDFMAYPKKSRIDNWVVFHPLDFKANQPGNP